jgi:hypothetical protein
LRAELQAERRGDALFMKQVAAAGTMADKTAAQMLRVQEAPLHSLAAVDGLLALAQKKTRRDALVAIGGSVGGVWGWSLPVAHCAC